MLDARYVAEHLDEVRTKLERRSSAWGPIVEDLSALAAERRRLIQETESLAARRNAANQEMSALAKGPDKTLFAARRDELKALSEQVKTAETKLSELLSLFESKLH